MTNSFDAIVVGARRAGSPTAMLLARNGYRVLVVDRATFPSDTISTDIVHPRGVAALATWGLVGRLTATGCPPIQRYTFDFGPFTIAGARNAGQSRLVLSTANRPVIRLLDELKAVNPRAETEVVMYGRGLDLVIAGKTTRDADFTKDVSDFHAELSGVRDRDEERATR